MNTMTAATAMITALKNHAETIEAFIESGTNVDEASLFVQGAAKDIVKAAQALDVASSEEGPEARALASSVHMINAKVLRKAFRINFEAELKAL